MRVRANRLNCYMAQVLPAAVLVLAPMPAAAQDGQFDLRSRATPAPAPVTAGPVDPDGPAPVRPRPLPEPAAAPPPSQPSAAAATPPSASPDSAAPGQRSVTPAIGARPQPAQIGAATPPPRSDLPAPDRTIPAASAPASSPAVAPAPASKPYQPRDLGLIDRSSGFGLWLAIGGLALLVLVLAWLVWSRWYRTRVTAIAEPEIERPPVPTATPEPARPPANDPAPAPAAPAEVTGLEVTLEATRMSATLLNTTLSYRLSVTNRGTLPLRDLRVDGDMVAAHATRKLDDLFGPYAAVLPQLHTVPGLAPGETVTLGGDIRLPLTAITPIRRGEATFFVPLARLRARGTSPIGLSVEGGGTFLVGQEPGANRKLQPFRLDLGPRNYSNLGQQLLRAA